jgi:hypothetical protein
MLAGVGGVAVRGDEKLRRHPGTAVIYGVGLALIVDEFVLLLDLQDVYWAKQGRISVDVAIGGIAAAGSVFAALPVPDRPIYLSIAQSTRSIGTCQYPTRRLTIEATYDL